MRLLIADDHPIVQGLEALLRSAGHTIVHRCSNGEQVLQALTTNRPEVLVLDVQMPGRTGIEILRQVKAEGHPIRVVTAEFQHQQRTSP